MANGVRFTKFIDPASSITRRQRYESIRTTLWNERSTHEPHWRDLNDYISPRKARWFTSDRNKGDRRNQKIIDSTATFALRTLQSGMHAGMTNPARPWMKLLTPDPDLNEYAPVKEWLHTVTQRMLTIFAGTNLYNALPVHYGCKGLFASAATGMLDDDEDLFRCYSYPVGSYGVATDKRGKINQWVYECEKTVLEIVEQYLVNKETNMIDWSRASNTVRTLWDRGDYNSKIDVCWLVIPNLDHRLDRFESKFKPFASIHIEKGQEKEDTFLRESGFDEFPILFSRWDVTGDDWWGTESPGMVALGDVKQLQTGEKRCAQAVEKMLNPSLQGPTHLRNQKASLLPGDITFVDVREGQKGLHPIHEVNMPIGDLELKQQGCRYRVQRAFYEDLFLMLAHSDSVVGGSEKATATEIVERKEEKLIAVGPVLERSKDELHDPLIDRSFAMGERRGMFPPPPKELQGMKLRVEYTSIMAQAQKLVGVVGMERFLSGASNLMAMKVPGIVHKVDWMQAVDDYADMLGVNPKLVIPDDEAKSAAQAEAQALAKQQNAMILKDQTQAASNLAGADMEGDNALKRMIEGNSEMPA